MDDADIFHKAVVAEGYEGGRLDTTSLHPPEYAASLAASLDYVAGRARAFLQQAATALPEMPPIHFDFIDSWDFNALAITGDGRYFIGVTRGAVATLGVLFDRMLADSQILRSIGNAEEEVVDLPLIRDLGPDFRKALISVQPFPEPRDSWRQFIARRLKDLALDFVTAHEFAHIANGHVDYNKEILDVWAIDELGRTARAPLTREYPLISQTMEMNADTYATHRSLRSELDKVVAASPRPGPEWDYYYSRPDMVASFWSYAVSVICRIFGEHRLTEGNMTSALHPPWRLRSVMIQREAGRDPRPQGPRTAPPRSGDELRNILAAIQAAHRDVERIFSQLTGKPEATEGLEDAWGDVGRQRIHRLQNYWQTKLRGELLEFEFAYHPLDSYGDSGEEATGEGS